MAKFGSEMLFRLIARRRNEWAVAVMARCDAFEFSYSNQTAKVLCMDTFRDNVLTGY